MGYEALREAPCQLTESSSIAPVSPAVPCGSSPEVATSNILSTVFVLFRREYISPLELSLLSLPCEPSTSSFRCCTIHVGILVEA
jgi:hypothetical protein